MATVVQPLPTIDILEQQERRRRVDSALGSTLAEGVSPSAESLALSERYVSGELSLKEYGDAVRALYGI
jgi:hypothetical protein